VTEALSKPEVGPAIGGSEGESVARSRRREELIEILEAVLLAVAAIVAAWSGYEANLWDGRQAHLYGVSSRDRVLADQAATRAGQERLYDSSVFTSWLQAKATSEGALAQQFERRFRPEFRPAFNAWLATDPFHNSSAPPGPLLMPQYHNAEEARQAVLGRRASAAFAAGTEARQTGDRYLRNTVLLATVLFLTAVAQRFKVRAVRLGLVAASGGLLGLALVFTATYPQA
jgi:hypothetical protein